MTECKELLERADKHLRELPPHAKQRESAQLIAELLAAAAPAAPGNAWANQPTSQDMYWYWDGDEDCPPFACQVLFSGGGKGRYFVARNFMGHSPWCDELGGKWLKIPQPAAPATEAKP